MAFLDAYIEEAKHRAIYGKTPCRAPALKVLMLEFLIPRVPKLTPEYNKLMKLYSKFNIGLPGPCEVSKNEMSIVPPISKCGDAGGLPPVTLSTIYSGTSVGPMTNTTEPNAPTEADILAGTLLKANLKIRLSIDLKTEAATALDQGIAWIAIDSTSYTGPFIKWHESPLNNGDIDSPFVGGAISNFIFKSSNVSVGGVDYDVFMFSYRSAFDSTLELLKS